MVFLSSACRGGLAGIVDCIVELKLEKSKTRADWEKSIKETKDHVGL